MNPGVVVAVGAVDRVVIDHRIMGGVPCVRGTRIPVRHRPGAARRGSVAGGVIADYPQLVVDDVLACLRFAADLTNQRLVQTCWRLRVFSFWA